MEASIQVGSALSDRPVPSGLAGLRVALVHDWLTGMRGGEKCLEVLCRAFPDATLHTLIHRPGALSPAIERMAIRPSPLQRLPNVFDYYRTLLPVMPLAAWFWRPRNVDLVISLSHCVAKAVRVPAGVPHVCYCFTPMRYAWHARDTYLDSMRERPLRRAAAKVILDRLRRWDKATVGGVSRFVAISGAVQERIAQCYGRDSQVIQPPVDTDFYTPAPVPRDDAYLCVSALVPYKRIDQAVAACSIGGRKLVVIGEGPDRASLERIAGPGVSFLGWQPDDVIRDHYRRCRALLFPGEEDFGIVPIEALACGAPVIALRKGGVAETVDEHVGRTYTSPTAEGLLEALEEWEDDRRPHDPAVGRRRAEAFSGEVFRDRLLGLITEVVGTKAVDRVPPAPHLGSRARVMEAREVA